MFNPVVNITPLSDVFRTIATQAGYDFFQQSAMIRSRTWNYTFQSPVLRYTVAMFYLLYNHVFNILYGCHEVIQVLKRILMEKNEAIRDQAEKGKMKDE